MRLAVLALMACSGLLGLVPQAEAAQAGLLSGAGGSSQACRDFAVATVATTITQGDIVYCLNTNGPVPTATSTLQVSAFITTPQLGAGAAVTFTPTVSSGSCTFGTATSKGTLMTGAFGTQSSSTWEVTMASQQCHGYIEGKVVSNSVTVFDDAFAFNIESADFTTYVDSTARMCAASALAASCTAPTVNNALSGSVGLTGSLALSGTLDKSLTRQGEISSDSYVRSCSATGYVLSSGGKFSSNGETQTCFAYTPNVAPGSANSVTAFLVTTTPLTSVTVNSAEVGSLTVTEGPCSTSGVVSDSYTTPTQLVRTTRWTITGLTTGATCQGYATGALGDVASGRFYTQMVPFAIRHPSETNAVTGTMANAVTGTLTVTNAGGQAITVSGTLDNLNRLCAASAVGTTCSTPTINAALSGSFSISSWPGLNAALSGSITVTNAGSQAITVSGTLDNLNRLCAASATGASCTAPTINLAGSLTVHNDGTLTVTNTGGQTMTLAGAATIHADGSLTVTNAGGQALTFAGPLTVHQDPICTAAAHCFVDSTARTTVVGNSSTVVEDLTGKVLGKWIPLVVIGAILVAAIFWSNPLLVVAGIIGFFVEYVPNFPFPENAWLMLLILSLVVPSLASVFGHFFTSIMHWARGTRRTA